MVLGSAVHPHHAHTVNSGLANLGAFVGHVPKQQIKEILAV